MGKEIGQDLWKVEGIQGVGSEFIKGAKPQGFSFALQHNVTPSIASPQNAIFGTVSNGPVPLPYTAMLEMVGVSGMITILSDEDYAILDPRRCNIVLTSSAAGAANIATDPLAQYAVAPNQMLANWSDTTQFIINGQDNYQDLTKYGAIMKNLYIQYYWELEAPIQVGQACTVQIYLRFKRV